MCTGVFVTQHVDPEIFGGVVGGVGVPEGVEHVEKIASGHEDVRLRVAMDVRLVLPTTTRTEPSEAGSNGRGHGGGTDRRARHGGG